MCRYANHQYKVSFVCVACRHVAQFRLDPGAAQPRCPACRQELWCAGPDFRAPGKGDDAGWRAVQAVRRTGGRYGTCGCGGEPAKPERLTRRELAAVRPDSDLAADGCAR